MSGWVKIFDNSKFFVENLNRIHHNMFKKISQKLFVLNKKNISNVNRNDTSNFSEEYWEGEIKNSIAIDPIKAQKILELALGQYPNNKNFLEYLDQVTEWSDIPIVIPDKVNNIRRKCQDEKPLVSITICTYNHEKYVAECLESVFNQDYSPLEIIISDDNSNDKTVDVITSVINKYHKREDFIFIKNNINMGYGGGGNWRGVCRLTRGEFIIQFCGDDVMHPNMVTEMVREWQSTGSMLVTVNAKIVDENSVYLNRNRIPEGEEINNSLESLARDGVNHTVFGAGTGYDRRLFEAFPQSRGNPPTILFTQDIIFPFYAYLIGEGCSVLKETLMSYRIHGNQNSYTVELEYEKNDKKKLAIEEKCWISHLAHSLYMKNVLHRLVEINSDRFYGIAEKLSPLLDHQMFLMSSRVISTRTKLIKLHNIREITN
jgi:glycosyltransferase involved in cell wall biosynthesis